MSTLYLMQCCNRKKYHDWLLSSVCCSSIQSRGGKFRSFISEVTLILITFQNYLSVISMCESANVPGGLASPWFFFKKLGVVVAESYSSPSPSPFSFLLPFSFPLPPFLFPFFFSSLPLLLKRKHSDYNSLLCVPWDHECLLQNKIRAPPN